MRRLRLTGTVEITGLDFWGIKSTLIIAPLPDQTNYGWVWRVGGSDVPITPNLFKVGGFLGRCVTLVYKKHVFHEFEHHAVLHTLGLRGVSIRLEGSNWPPFMCQVELRRKIRPLLISQAPLRPYSPPVQRVWAKNGIERTTSFIPNRTQDLVIKTGVDYGDEKVGSHQLAFWGGIDEQDLLDVLSARTFGRPQLLQPVAWAASKLPVWRGQSTNILWKPWFKQPGRSFYSELARHKVLDASLFSFAAPSNSFLAGTVDCFRSDHALDLELIKELHPHDNVTALRKAV